MLKRYKAHLVSGEGLQNTGEVSSPLWTSVSQSVVWGDVLPCPFPSGVPGSLTAPQLPATKPGAWSCEFRSHGMKCADHFPAGPASPQAPYVPGKTETRDWTLLSKEQLGRSWKALKPREGKSKAHFEDTLCEAKEHSMVLATAWSSLWKVIYLILGAERGCVCSCLQAEKADPEGKSDKHAAICL